MMQVNGAVAEAVHGQQFEPGANVVGKRPLAASHEDWKDDQMVLVDQAGSDCMVQLGVPAAGAGQ